MMNWLRQMFPHRRIRRIFNGECAEAVQDDQEFRGTHFHRQNMRKYEEAVFAGMPQNLGDFTHSMTSSKKEDFNWILERQETFDAEWSNFTRWRNLWEKKLVMGKVVNFSSEQNHRCNWYSRIVGRIWLEEKCSWLKSRRSAQWLIPLFILGLYTGTPTCTCECTFNSVVVLEQMFMCIQRCQWVNPRNEDFHCDIVSFHNPNCWICRALLFDKHIH